MKTVVNWLFFLFFVNTNLVSFAQTMPPTFSQRIYGILNYDFFTPNSIDTVRKYPLIMYLQRLQRHSEKEF